MINNKKKVTFLQYYFSVHRVGEIYNQIVIVNYLFYI